MKKTFLALLLAGCSGGLFAQDDSLANKTTLSSDMSYNAYATFTATPPNGVQTYMLRDYPTATDVHWQMVGDWWHGYYLTNGQPTHVYYGTSWHVPTAGQSFTVALPVRQSLIPETVTSKAVQLFGPTLYDINTV